jgi:hypothetical protein
MVTRVPFLSKSHISSNPPQTTFRVSMASFCGSFLSFMLFVLIFCTIGTLPSMPKSHLHDHFRLPFASRLGALGVVHKNRTYIKLTRNTTQRNTSSTDNHVRRIATNAAIVHPILECSPTKSCSLSIATTLNVVKPSHHVLIIYASLLCHSFLYATLLI